MDSKHVDFNEQQIEQMAKFIATLIHEGVTFRVDTLIGCWSVVITG